jgi:hypothetical protein
MVKRKHKRKVKAVKRKPVKRRKRAPRRRKVTRVKRKPAKRKPAKRKRRVGRKVVRQVERKSVERVLAGKRKRRRPRKRRVVMAGTRRRRSVGKSGGNKMLIGLAIGAAAIYFLTKGSSPTYPGTSYQLPPIATTQNTTRNAQASNLVQYAVAGGLAIDAIIKLIDKLNTSSDQEVENIYDVYHTSGVQGLEYYA